jgi:hypothetical protein
MEHFGNGHCKNDEIYPGELQKMGLPKPLEAMTSNSSMSML